MLLPAVEKTVGSAQPTQAVIWLHGLGANGHDFAPIVSELGLLKQATHFVFPHAPTLSVTLNGGILMPAWFDIDRLEEGHHFDRPGIESSSQSILAWITHLEKTKGIPSHKVILIGFSQGGAVSLYTGLRIQKKLAGVIGLSTYLPGAEDYPKALGPYAKQTPFWLAHGTQDPVVLPQWGQMTHEFIAGLGITCDWQPYPMEHTVCMPQLKQMGLWMQNAFDRATD